jgi:hypothetical protein
MVASLLFAAEARSSAGVCSRRVVATAVLIRSSNAANQPPLQRKRIVLFGFRESGGQTEKESREQRRLVLIRGEHDTACGGRRVWQRITAALPDGLNKIPRRRVR